MKTAKDAYRLADKMWADKLPKEDLFEFVRRLLFALGELAEEGKG